MAGVTITVDDHDVLAKLQQLKNHCANLRPVFREIGEYLNLSTHERFNRQVDPDGNRWAETSDVTKARKTRNKDKILIESGDLMSTLRYQVLDDALEFGTDRVYGAMMQFGGKKSQYPNLWGDIPARPFLGLSIDDKAEILEILGDYLLQ